MQIDPIQIILGFIPAFTILNNNSVLFLNKIVKDEYERAEMAIVVSTLAGLRHLLVLEIFMQRG